MTRDCRSWECRSLFAGICLRGSVEMFLIVVDVAEVCLSGCLVIVGEFAIDSSLSLSLPKMKDAGSVQIDVVTLSGAGA